MLEQNVVRAVAGMSNCAGGISNCTTEGELRRMIRRAGFKPVQRDTLNRISS